MNIQKLTQEHCPNGVEYKALGEVVTFNRGTAITQKDIQSGEIPVIAGGQKPAYYGNKSNREGETIVIAGSGAYAGFVSFWDKPIFVSDAFSVDTKQSDVLITRYLYHFLLNEQNNIYAKKKGSGVPHIYGKDLANIKIPIPAIEVQYEIVRILDKLTEHTEELNNNLSKELILRKKQYEYYRDSLILEQNTEYKKIEEIATEMYRGSGIKRNEVTKDGIPCVRYGEIYTTYNIWFDECVSHTHEEKIQSKKYFENGDILFAITGESVEDIAKSCAYVGNKKCLAGGDIVVMKHQQNPKYLAYALSTFEAQRQKSCGKIKSKVVHASVPSIKSISIPVPSLQEQERIVSILDKFDALCNDLSQGLPAEIELRKKQYEYYRDKLLQFEKKHTQFK